MKRLFTLIIMLTITNIHSASHRKHIETWIEFRNTPAGLYSNLTMVLEWMYCVKHNPDLYLFINMKHAYGFNGNAFLVLFKPFEDSQITAVQPSRSLMNYYFNYYPKILSLLKEFPTDGMRNYHENKYVYQTPELFTDPDFPLFRNRIHPIIMQYMQPADDLQERIDRITQIMNEPLDLDEPNLKIGIHVRCQNHYNGYVKTPSEFLDDIENDIDAIIESKGDRPIKIFLATLLEPLVERLSAKYPIVICDMIRASDTTTDWNRMRTTSDINGARDAIVDAWCLANCDELWGSSSNVTVFAACVNPELKIYMLPSLETYNGK